MRVQYCDSKKVCHMEDLINGVHGIELVGRELNDGTGSPVSTAGDVNGDGISDFIISASYPNLPPESDLGAVYLIFGSSNSEHWRVGHEELFSLADGVRGVMFFTQEEDAQVGASISGAGDFNGDGIDDILIGARRADTPGRANSGAIYLVFGSNSSDYWNFGMVDLATSSDGSRGIVFYGEATGWENGVSVSNVGDFNGDDLDDIVVGTHVPRDGAGKSCVIFGTNNLSAFSSGVLELADWSNGIRGVCFYGESSLDYSGYSVQGGGDINGDGLNDLLIGAHGETPMGLNRAGTTYVIFGSSNSTLWGEGSIQLSDISDGIHAFALEGEKAEDVSGWSLGSGDFNGDGFSDILLGAPHVNYHLGVPIGKAYIIFGSNHSSRWSSGHIQLSAIANGVQGVVLTGELSSAIGFSVDGIGDFNGDDIDDFLIGAPAEEQDTGISYLVFGSDNLMDWNFSSISLNNTDVNQFRGLALYGGTISDQAGISVSGAGDINGDGYPDILIGATGLASPLNLPKCYVIFGDNRIPVFINNKLTTNQGGSFMLDTSMLLVFHPRSDNTTLVFDAPSAPEIVVESLFNPEAPVRVSNFTQQDVIDGIIRFTHDDSGSLSSCNITVSPTKSLVRNSVTSTTEVDFNLKPISYKHEFPPMLEGGEGSLTYDVFNATDLDTPLSKLFYTKLNCSHVTLFFNNEPEVPIDRIGHTNMSQPNVVKFRQDGAPVAPSCWMTLSDDRGASVGPFLVTSSNFTLVNDNPEVTFLSPVSFQQTLNERTLVPIDSSNIYITDEETTDESKLVCELKTVPQDGNIRRSISGTSVKLVQGETFTKQDLTMGRILYDHDNSRQTEEDHFSFVVHDSEGGISELQTLVIAIQTRAKPPVFKNTQLNLNGGEVAAHPWFHLVEDPDTLPDQLLMTPETRGFYYAYPESTDQPLKSFYDSNVSSLVTVTEDIWEKPWGTLHVSDKTFNVSTSLVINFNARARLEVGSIIIDQGTTTPITSQMLSAIDSETFKDAIVIQPNTTEGFVQYSSSPGKLDEFPQFPLILGAVEFKHNGTEKVPSLQFRAGDAQKLWTAWQAMSVTLNRRPVAIGTIPDVIVTEGELTRFALDPDGLFTDDGLLNFALTQEGGIALPKDMTFFPEDGYVEGTWYTPTQSYELRGCDDRNLCSRLTFNVNAKASEQTDYQKLFFDFGVPILSTLGTAFLYLIWRKRKAKHRNDFKLANQLRKILNLKYYDFGQDEGDTYKTLIDKLQTHFELKHNDFYNQLPLQEKEIFPMHLARYLKEKDYVSNAGVFSGTFVWATCFSRGWSNELNLGRFGNNIVQIAADVVKSWQKNIESKLLEGDIPTHLVAKKHGRVDKVKECCSLTCCSKFWGALFGCNTSKPSTPEMESKLSLSPDDIEMVSPKSLSKSGEASPHELEEDFRGESVIFS